MTDAPFAPPTAPGSPSTAPEPATGGGTLVEERPAPDLDSGDHERFAHYVRKDKIVESAVMGTPIEALCGKKWIPGRDPNRFPVCPDCKRIYEGIPGDDSKDSDGEGS